MSDSRRPPSVAGGGSTPETRAVQHPATEDPSELHYLGFFRLYAIRVVAYVSTLYSHLKDLSGPIKPAVENLEAVGWKYLRPVSTTTQDKGYEWLVWTDGKVGQFLSILEGYIHLLTLGLYYIIGLGVKAKDAAESAVLLGKDVVNDVTTLGPTETTKAYYNKYEPVVAGSLYKGWKYSLSLPLAPQLVELASPAVVGAAEVYNRVASNAKGWTSVPSTVKPYVELLPLVPVDNIKRTIKEDTKEALAGHGPAAAAS